MHFTSTTSALLLFSTVYAQYGDSATTASPPTATTSTSPADPTHTIWVGKDGLTFTPNVTTANANTKLEFHFFPATHSVAQASFANPCEPVVNGTSFFSGGQVTPAGQENENVFTVTVNDTKPIWFYCGYPGHCEKGMVGAVNVPTDGSKTLEQFAAAAAKVVKTEVVNATQGGVLGPKSNSTSSSSSSSGSSTGTATGSSASATKSSGAVGQAQVAWMGVSAAFAGAVGVSYLLGM